MANTASTSTTGASQDRHEGRDGFTLVELLLATVLSALVFAGIFSAYLFMARNLTRLANSQQQQVQTRHAFLQVAKDVNEAIAVPSASDVALVLSLSGGGTVTYTYNPSLQILSREYPAGTTKTLIDNLTAFSFVYYGKYGPTALSPSPGVISNPSVNVGRIEIHYRSAVGSAVNGTSSATSVVSSRMVLRAKTNLGQ
jgi:prepilin-type N-terminal cleavage/methylation domain-containing protein